MNKLNNPIVILALVILSISNLILSISILTKLNKGNDGVDDIDSNKEQSITTTEVTTQSQNKKLQFSIYDTSGNSYNSNWQADNKYNYNSSKEENYLQFCYNIQGYCNRVYNVSCDEDQCLIHIYSQDSNGNSRSEDKLYSADVSKTIIDRFENQEEITVDMLIEENEAANGQIVMEFTSLPSYIITTRDPEQSNYLNYDDQCYNIDDDFLSYLNSLR